jgi:hypothetical protein
MYFRLQMIRPEPSAPSQSISPKKKEPSKKSQASPFCFRRFQVRPNDGDGDIRRRD